MSDPRLIFTGAGFPNGHGGAVSYEWIGISATLPTNGNYDLPFQSIVNGEIRFEEQSNPVTIQTTAWNGFADGYVENSVISGTVNGFIQPSPATPAPAVPNMPNTNRVWWMKIIAGSLYYEGKALLNGFSFGVSLDEVVSVQFQFRFIGQPRTTQFNYLTGGPVPS